MSAKTAPGWGREHLTTIRSGDVDLDPTEQFAVHQTLIRYAFALDQRDLQALRGVLTDDASWHLHIDGEEDLGPIIGRDSILEFVGGAMTAETDQRRHHLLNVTLHSADSDTALAQAYLMLTANTGGNAGVLATGFYTFRLRRSEAGWQITELLLGTDNAW
jgi:ketosteroid isomerase-like protein